MQAAPSMALALGHYASLLTQGSPSPWAPSWLCNQVGLRSQAVVSTLFISACWCESACSGWEACSQLRCRHTPYFSDTFLIVQNVSISMQAAFPALSPDWMRLGFVLCRCVKEGCALQMLLGQHFENKGARSQMA